MSQVLVEEKVALGIVKRQACSKEECRSFHAMVRQNEPLPKGVYVYSSNKEEFYRINEVVHSDDGLILFLSLQRNRFLKSINQGISAIAIVVVIAFFLGVLATVF